MHNEGILHGNVVVCACYCSSLPSWTKLKHYHKQRIFSIWLAFWKVSQYSVDVGYVCALPLFSNCRQFSLPLCCAACHVLCCHGNRRSTSVSRRNWRRSGRKHRRRWQRKRGSTTRRCVGVFFAWQHLWWVFLLNNINWITCNMCVWIWSLNVVFQLTFVQLTTTLWFKIHLCSY